MKNEKGFILIKEYPGSPKLGTFEPYTTGLYLKYPQFWKPVAMEKEANIQTYEKTKVGLEVATDSISEKDGVTMFAFVGRREGDKIISNVFFKGEPLLAVEILDKAMDDIFQR